MHRVRIWVEAPLRDAVAQELDGSNYQLESFDPEAPPDRGVVVLRHAQLADELAKQRIKLAVLAVLDPSELNYPTRAIADFVLSEWLPGELLARLNRLTADAQDAAHEALALDLKKIRNAGTHLLSLINDVLDMSKIESGKMDLDLQQFDLRQLLNGIRDTVGPLAQQNGNQLELDLARAPERVVYDEQKLRQVLINLMSNACKFTTNGRIRLDATVDGLGWLELRVTDTGIGLSDEQRGRLFRPFVQADSSTTRRYGGTGLGLAISQRFCELMGGRIDVVSRPGEGSCFTVRLPERTPRASQRALDAAPEREGALVLVIDDDQSTYATLSATLSERGFRVEWAGTGDAGLEAARQQQPSVIVLNINMPAKAGWTVLALLKEDAETAPIPVVMVTSLESPDSGMALGATDYLVKPIQPGQLVKAVRRRLTPTNNDFTVLVVDDDPSMREIVERTLLGAGYRVTTAANGNEGLLAVEAMSPGLVVLDLMMPGMDGFEFLRRLKENPRHFQLPVLVATAKELSESEHRLLAESATRVIQKLAHSRAELMHVVERQVSALCKTRSANETPALPLSQATSA